jgi:hypothetical protein
MLVFWVETPFGLIDSYEHFGETYFSTFKAKDGGSMFHQNVGAYDTYLQVCTVVQTWTLTFLLLWEPQFSLYVTHCVYQSSLYLNFQSLIADALLPEVYTYVGTHSVSLFWYLIMRNVHKQSNEIEYTV